MSTVLKPLYIAKSLEELNKKVPSDKVKSSTPKVLSRLAEKLLLKARDEVLAGDEEQAYVLYMRFVDIFQAIRNSKAYKTEKKELDKLISPAKASKALGEAEKLSKSLKERYAVLSKPSEKKLKLDDSVEQGFQSNDQVVPSSPEGPLFNGTDGSQPLLPLGDNFVTSSKQDVLPRISAQELYAHLMSSSDVVLVLDCRARADYNASHPDSKKFPQWVSVPEETVRKGITDESVSSFLSPTGRKLWKDRASKKWLVLVDELEASGSDSSIMALRDALMKWNTTTALPREPFILEGGYAMWHLSYAVTCVGVYKRKPSSHISVKGTEQNGLTTDVAPTSVDYPEFPALSELTDPDTQDTNQPLSEGSTFSHLQPCPSNSTNLASLVPSSSVGPRDVNAFTNQTQNQYPTQHPPHLGRGKVPSPSVPIEGNAYVPSVTAYPPMMPSYAPLPPPSSAMPVLLTLEGESELLTPSLNDDLPPMMLSHEEEDNTLDSAIPVSYTGGEQVAYAQPHPLNQLPSPAVSAVSNPIPPVSDVLPPVPVGYNQPPATHQVTYEHHSTVVPQPHPWSQSQLHNKQPHDLSSAAGQAQPNWYGVPAPVSTGQHGPPQPHVPIPIQQPNEAQPSSIETLVHHRVAHGPISDPPSYEQARQLPSHALIPPPIPPPTSLHREHVPVQQVQPHDVTPHQQTQFVQLSQPQYQQPHSVHHPSEYQGVSINPKIAERDAKIAQLMKLLEEKDRESQSKANEEQQMKKLQDEEKKELKKLKETIEAERSQLEQDKQQQQQAAERDVLNLRQKLEEERAQMALALEQERLKLEATKAQYVQDLQRREIEMKQMREQYEREITERQRQSAVMQQLEERRKQEHMFSLKQGLPQGWEKRLDSTTGRFYYVDHNSKTTHWNPPTSWLDYQAEMQRQQQEKNRLAHISQQQEALNARLRAQQQHGKGVAPHETPPVAPQPPVSVGSTQPPAQPVSLKTPTEPSSKTPTESQPTQGPSAKPHPTVDRSVKPPPSTGMGMPVVPDRSTKPVAIKKPIMTPALWKQKTSNLQPVFGSGCYSLTGLRNLGNTCYMNSTLQCLGCTTPVVHHFTTSNYENDINHMNPLGKQGVIAMEFAWLMKAMWGGQYRSVSPKDFKGMIDKFVPQMRGNNQQDSQEFLAFLMDGLHEDLNKVKKRQYVIDVDNSKLSDGEAAKQAWLNHRKQNDSIIVDFFQGLFRSTVVCNNCKKRSLSFEPFMFLTLPIPPGSQAYKLEDCIRLFSAQEQVSRSCSSCNHSVAFKRMELWKLPPILLINLKRFTFEGQWREKRQNYIDYPVREPLNMSQYVVGEQPRTYQLYAVSNHFGSLAGGHYTACCKNPYKKSFYNFDDHEVREAQPRQIKSSAAYILFYTSLDLTPPKMF